MNGSISAGQDGTYYLDPNGICVIEPQGKITSTVTATIAEQTMTHIVQHGLPTGLLIDVRQNPLLSIVRLSNLLDSLTGLGVPVAVVFATDEQQQLASLLHNTLAHKDSVVYFTDRQQAIDCLLHITGRGQPGDSDRPPDQSPA